jgi:hypothetical protein
LLETIRARSNEADVAEAAIMFGAKDDRKSSSKSGKKKDKVDVDVEAASTRSRETGRYPSHFQLDLVVLFEIRNRILTSDS